MRHYGVDVRYTLATGALSGSTTLTARATQDLSRFNLDLVLHVDSVRIDGVPAGARPRPTGTSSW